MTITNNLCHCINVGVNTTNWSASGNWAIQSGVSGTNARMDYAATPGGPKIDAWKIGNVNPIGIVSALACADVFATWDPANFRFDTTLKPSVLPTGVGAPAWTNIK